MYVSPSKWAALLTRIKSERSRNGEIRGGGYHTAYHWHHARIYGASGQAVTVHLYRADDGWVALRTSDPYGLGDATPWIWASRELGLTN